MRPLNGRSTRGAVIPGTCCGVLNMIITCAWLTLCSPFLTYSPFPTLTCFILVYIYFHFFPTFIYFFVSFSTVSCFISSNFSRFSIFPFLFCIFYPPWFPSHFLSPFLNMSRPAYSFFSFLYYHSIPFRHIFLCWPLDGVRVLCWCCITAFLSLRGIFLPRVKVNVIASQ